MTESQTAPESAAGLAATSRGLMARSSRWRLPITYGAIASTALALDLALILGSATLAEAVYHKIPDAFEGEYSHTIAAAIFVAILFVAAMRVQRLYGPTRLMVWEDQARSVLGAWCGAFLILASGVFSWGVSHDLSRGDVLLFWAIGVVALLAHRAAWMFALPRALESGALRGRTIVSLTCEENVPPQFIENLTRHGYHAVAHFDMPEAGTKADEIIERVISLCRTSAVQEVMLFVDPERMSNVRWVARRLRVLPLPVTLVPFGTLAQLFQRARYDIGDTVAIELQRAALSPTEQAVKRAMDIVLSLLGLIILSPILLAVAVAIRLDSPGPALFRQTRHGFNGRPFRIFKFRTMTVMENGDVVEQAKKSDKRVTESAGGCVDIASTSFRSCLMYFSATCRWWGRGHTLRRMTVILPPLSRSMRFVTMLSPGSPVGRKFTAPAARPIRWIRCSEGSSWIFGTSTTGAFGSTSPSW